MYWFLILLIPGFVFAGASAFTAMYARWWGERKGKIATSVLRNFLGIPLWYVGLVMAWFQPAPALVVPGSLTTVFAWILIFIGLLPVVWGHLALGWKTHFPSIKDPMVRDGIYSRVRHPIYAGGLLMFLGAMLANPTSTFALACALGFVWLIVQARLEEIDLLQRMPEYGDYMKDVPRFLPRIWMRKVHIASENARKKPA